MGDGPTDAGLLAAVAGGDLDALRQLYQRHAPWLQVRLARRGADPETVADTLQDTFVAVWHGAARFRGEGEVGAWIWGIAVRRLATHRRARSKVGGVDLEDAGARSNRRGRPIGGHGPGVPAAEDQVLAGIEYGALGAALADLSPPMRAVVQTVVFDGHTTRAAAEMLRIPEGTVKTRLARAKARLRSSLAKGRP